MKHLFFKKGNKQAYMMPLSDQDLIDIKNKVGEKYSKLDGSFAYIDDLLEKGWCTRKYYQGVLFIIDDDEKAQTMKEDIAWINKVREIANENYPEASMFFIELQRILKVNKESDKKHFENKLARIRDKYPDYVPELVTVFLEEFDELLEMHL